MSEHEDRVRERAYHLWEDAGRPDGRDDEFWHAARELIEAEAAAEPAEPAPTPVEAPAEESRRRSSRG
jgi:hypothetical protein